MRIRAAVVGDGQLISSPVPSVSGGLKPEVSMAAYDVEGQGVVAGFWVKYLCHWTTTIRPLEID